MGFNGFITQIAIKDPNLPPSGDIPLEDLDPNKKEISNTRGRLAFVPPANENQPDNPKGITLLNFNMKDNLFLDNTGFAPFAEVVDNITCLENIARRQVFFDDFMSFVSRVD